MKQPYIVKVQLSIGGNDGRKVLIYNEDETIMQEFPAPKWLVKALHNEPKSFWLAETTEDGYLNLIEETDWQDW